MTAIAESFADNSPPLAFAMWDFSWLERRWPGGGYEDPARALDELVERGYNALRIDPYPHLLLDPERTAFLEPVWTVHEWGCPHPLEVEVLPPLLDFLNLCGERNIKVGLSTWFRKDTRDRRSRITSPEAHAEIWSNVVALLQRHDLARHLCYVDLCNEFPGELWAPFFDNRPDSSWNCMTEKALTWMETALRYFRTSCPGIPATFSVVGFDASVRERWKFMDLLEPHVWMAQSSDFLDQVGGNYNNFDFSGYAALAARGASVYRAREEHWRACLAGRIRGWAEISRACDRPLVTTECWAVVNYRDWPGLDWGWIKELCAFGVAEALGTARWTGIATSNFCGPQFTGMWEDVIWHQALTRQIKAARGPDLRPRVGP
jgi:hypothetical protein